MSLSFVWLDDPPPGDGDARQTASGEWAVDVTGLYRWLSGFSSKEDAEFIGALLRAANEVPEDERKLNEFAHAKGITARGLAHIKNAGVKTIEDFVGLPDKQILKIPYIGRKTLASLRNLAAD